MKIAGKSISKPKPLLCVIPKDGHDLAFYADAVIDDTEFEALVPDPIAPLITYAKTGKKEFDYNDRTYQNKVNLKSRLRMAWTILKSLEATENLEWDTVDIKNPDTWLNYRKELTDSGFTDSEIAEIIGTVFKANAMDQGRFEEAKERFIRSQAPEQVVV